MSLHKLSISQNPTFIIEAHSVPLRNFLSNLVAKVLNCAYLTNRSSEKHHGCRAAIKQPERLAGGNQSFDCLAACRKTKVTGDKLLAERCNFQVVSDC